MLRIIEKTLQASFGSSLDPLRVPEDIKELENLPQLLLPYISAMQRGEIETLGVFVSKKIPVNQLILKLIEILPTLPISKFKLHINDNSIQEYDISPLFPIFRAAKWQALSIDALLAYPQQNALYDVVRENENITVFYLKNAFSCGDNAYKFCQHLAATPNYHLQELSLPSSKMFAQAATLLLNSGTFPNLKFLYLPWNRLQNLVNLFWPAPDTVNRFKEFCDKIPESQLEGLSLGAPSEQPNAKILCDALLKFDRPFTLTLIVEGEDITNEALDEYCKVLYQNPFVVIIISDLLDYVKNRKKVEEIELLSYENASNMAPPAVETQTSLEDFQKSKDRAIMQRFHSLQLANYTKDQLANMGSRKAISNRVPTLQSFAAKTLMKYLETRGSDLERLPFNLLLTLPSRSMTHHLSILKAKYDKSPLAEQLARLNLQDGTTKEEADRKALLGKLRAIS